MQMIKFFIEHFNYASSFCVHRIITSVLRRGLTIDNQFGVNLRPLDAFKQQNNR